jgi:hypothetical protein
MRGSDRTKFERVALLLVVRADFTADSAVKSARMRDLGFGLAIAAAIAAY